MKQPDGLKILIAIVVAAVVIVVGIGFYLSGTPSNARAEKLDQQRVNDLTQIQNAVENYYTTRNILPKTFDDLKNQYGYIELVDPLTHEQYEYRETATTAYELCATFQTDTTNEKQTFVRPKYPGFEPLWQHPAEKKCFSHTVRVKLGQPMM
mgnify:CR=1 FL=1